MSEKSETHQHISNTDGDGLKPIIAISGEWPNTISTNTIIPHLPAYILLTAINRCACAADQRFLESGAFLQARLKASSPDHTSGLRRQIW